MPRSSVVRLLAALFISFTMVGGGQVAAQDTSSEWVMFCRVGENGESTYVIMRQRYERLDHSDGNTYEGECASDAANGWQALMAEDTVVTYCDNGITKQAPANTIGIRIELRYRDMPTSFLMWNEAPSGVERGPCDSNGDGGETPGNGDGGEEPEEPTIPDGWEEVTYTPGDTVFEFCRNGRDDSATLLQILFEEVPGVYLEATIYEDAYIPWPDLAPEIIRGECDADSEPGNGDSDEIPGNGNAVANSFTLTAAQRMCADQSFEATWTGINISSLEFALNNSSDDWSSGWLTADPAAGSFSAEVDHHGYDRVGAQVTYADGATEQMSVDTSNCATAAAPAPIDPPASADPPASQGSSSPGNGSSSGSGQVAASVSSLPNTGTGIIGSNAVLMAAAATMVLAGVALVSRSGFTRR